MDLNKKVVFIATDSSEIVLPISRFTQGLTNALDTSVVLYFDSSIEGRPEKGYTAVTVTCSSDSEGVLTSILKNFASSRDLVIDLSNSHSKITAVAVSAGQEMSAGAGQAVVKSITTATANVYAYDSGKCIALNRAAGITVDLPAATGSGNKFYFVVGTALSSNDYIIRVTGDDTFVGYANNWDIDATAAAYYTATGTDDTITMNAGTTGGKAGDWFEAIDIAADTWAVKAHVTCFAGSNVADPFSATVS